jgi:hypothetical protein
VTKQAASKASSSLAEHSAVRPRVKLPISGDVALMLLAVSWFLAAMLKITSFLPSVIGGPEGCMGSFNFIPQGNSWSW